MNAFSALDDEFETSLAVVGSAVEVVIGLALILRFRPSITVPAAGVLFVLMAGVSGVGTFRGVASCGCFGTVVVPPWVMLVFDVAVAGALLWGLKASGALRQKQAAAIIAACIASGFVGIAVGSVLYPSLGAVTSVLSPDAIAGAKTVFITPRDLPSDQPFPLLPYIRIDADLSQGEWKVIFARAGCQRCERRLREGGCEPDGQECVAVVLAEEKKDWVLNENCEAVLGHLSSDKIWSFDAPLTLKLTDGRLAKAK